MRNNPVIWSDYPDVDVIRVGDTYYMVSTTMHFFPGCVLLRSHDLVHWETAAHVYDTLDSTPAQRLDEGWIYGRGMWAATLRVHRGRFYILFVANDTHRTYCFTATDPEGPWERRDVAGFYHDASLLFDDDGRVYLAHGNRHIRLTEMEPDLSGPKAGGFDRVIVSDRPEVPLGYEGSHLYRIGGRYYLFLIHWPATGTRRRIEAMFWTDSLDAEWQGGDVLDDDMGFFNQGVAQGGIVDTPSGEWYAMLFQDHGAVGRIPVLVPLTWKDGLPVLAPPPAEIHPEDSRPGYRYAPLWESDDFTGAALKSAWEWNHEPDLSLVSFGGGELRIRTDRVVPTAETAKNMLTQRTFGPGCRAEVTVDGTGLGIGDEAGLCALMGRFACLTLRREEEGDFLVYSGKAEGQVREFCRIPVTGGKARLRASFDFRDRRDTVTFHRLREDGAWEQIGEAFRLFYDLTHFTGCRIGLFVRSGATPGGEGAFAAFSYAAEDDNS